MEKDYYQSNITIDAVRQLNEGLYLIQSEIDNIKVQVQQSKQQRKVDQTSTYNNDFVVQQNAKYAESFSNNDSILYKLSAQMFELKNEINALKRDNSQQSQQLTTEEIAKVVNVELSKCFEAMLFEVKNTIVSKVEEEFSTLKANNTSSEVVKEKEGNNEETDQNIENVAIGVEQKLDLKFSEMFLELNKVVDEIKELKSEKEQENPESTLSLNEMVGGMLNRLNLLTMKMDTLENLIKEKTQSIPNSNENNDNNLLIDRFDKLAEYVTDLVGNNGKNKEVESGAKCVSIDENSQLSEKLEELTELINSRKDLDFRPIFEVINELDEKLSDIKYCVSELKLGTKSDNTNAEDNGNVAKILNETIPRIIRESIASSLVNVDDSENMGSYEKIVNQINMIFANEEQKFDELFKLIAGIKEEIELTEGIPAGKADEFPPNEIEETLSSLRNELMSLSKLISDAEGDDEVVETAETAIPKAISDAADTLDEMTKEIYSN